jgi:fructose/tagatose bisphosphate aldolase
VSARVIVHSPAHAKAALAAAAALQKPVILLSAPGAGAMTGPRWFLALVAQAARDYPAAQYEVVLDCADEPGMVLAALRAGVKRVRFTGAAQVRTKLVEIAAALGAEIEDGAPPALDLLEARDPETACRGYVSSCLD